MRRTYLRPLPTGMIKPTRAKNFGLTLVSVGVIVLSVFINNITAILAILTVILYLFVYTPLKKKITWLNTSIGAIPGALPPVGGWTATSGQLDRSLGFYLEFYIFGNTPIFMLLLSCIKMITKRLDTICCPFLKKKAREQIVKLYGIHYF